MLYKTGYRSVSHFIITPSQAATAVFAFHRSAGLLADTSRPRRSFSSSYSTHSVNVSLDCTSACTVRGILQEALRNCPSYTHIGRETACCDADRLRLRTLIRDSPGHRSGKRGFLIEFASNPILALPLRNSVAHVDGFSSSSVIITFTSATRMQESDLRKMGIERYRM